MRSLQQCVRRQGVGMDGHAYLAAGRSQARAGEADDHTTTERAHATCDVGNSPLAIYFSRIWAWLSWRLSRTWPMQGAGVHVCSVPLLATACHGK